MISYTEGVDTVGDLAEFLNTKGVAVSERTLWRWRKGTGFNKNRIMAAAKAMGMGLKDVIILDEGVLIMREFRHEDVFIDPKAIKRIANASGHCLGIDDQKALELSGQLIGFVHVELERLLDREAVLQELQDAENSDAINNLIGYWRTKAEHYLDYATRLQQRLNTAEAEIRQLRKENDERITGKDRRTDGDEQLQRL